MTFAQRFKQIGKEIEWWIREIRLTPKVFHQYGTRFPTCITFQDTDIHIYIDPKDRRARKQILFDLIRDRQHRNSRFWKDFVAHVRPTTALDIGANYGECVFSIKYPPNVKVIAIEANPKLMPSLRKSLHDHPSAPQIEVVNNLASDKSSPAIAFYLNRDSSGRSTAVRAIADDSPAVETVEVPAVRIDDILSRPSYRTDRLVFKVDVEGFEPKVLLGMIDTLQSVSLAVGYVEIDSEFLSRTGWTLEQYDRKILSSFQLYVPVDQKSLLLRKYDSLQTYRKKFGDDRIHTDLILLKNPKGLDWLPPAWQVIE